jgi:plastocyanin
VAETEAPTLAPTAAPAVPATVRGAIGDNTFTPQVLKVPAGTTIVWTHGGQKPHTVTADDGSVDSETLRAGASFQQTFKTPGAYAYYCDFHGAPGGVGMAARVEVQ